MASRDGLERQPLPADLQSFSELLVGHVQVALRLLHARVTQHQLDDADIHAIPQQTAGALMTQIMRVQIDLPKLGAVHASTGLRALPVVTVREQQQGFPCRLEVSHELAGG